MTQVYVKYNPYRLETVLTINGREVPDDSVLHKVTKGKRLQEWIGQFPEMLRNELNTVDFSLEFCGMELDWDDFEEAFKQAQKQGNIITANIKYTAGKSDEDINERIENVFMDLQTGPIDDFRDPKLIRAFENINNSIFPINVIATMSSGKSTLINALLGQKLMPAQNEACTATITEILDSDNPGFAAVAYDENNVEIRNVPELTYEIMNKLNDDPEVYCIAAEGDIPFLDARSTALKLVDTPGPNNARNQAHKNTTYRAINNSSNNLILYVMNGTQLNTTDDGALLGYIAEQIQKGGKQVRDRFLFVVNKMDAFDPDNESIEDAIADAKQHLAKYHIDDPQIFPCSALMALNIRTLLADIDIENLTLAQRRELSNMVKKTLTNIEIFLDSEPLHLEKYSTLSPSAQQEISFKLDQAIKNGDMKEQALIHSGIYSIEAAITAYVKKYAKTKKVKDLVESFQEVLESSNVLAKARERVMTDADAAKACAERAATVQAKIADGKEAQEFKAKIEALNPMSTVQYKVDQLKQNATSKTTKIFRPYGETLTSREEAKRLVTQFSTFSSDAMAELTSELESVINNEIVNTGEQLLMEYQEKISKIDETSENEQLDFKTIDLIKGALQTMRETAESWTTDDFANETVGDIGETTYEERTYYEKIGQEAEEVVSGSHEEKIGTKRVKVGTERVKVGTRSVGKWYKPWTWFKKEDVYDYVDKYEDQDVYKTILDYKTVMRDVFEERIERIEKFSVSTASIQRALIAKMRLNLDDGIQIAMGFAEEQVKGIKKQFANIFTELDAIIAEKYEELKKCATDESEKKSTLEKNKNILNWIETNMNEIDSILDI